MGRARNEPDEQPVEAGEAETPEEAEEPAAEAEADTPEEPEPAAEPEAAEAPEAAEEPETEAGAAAEETPPAEPDTPPAAPRKRVSKPKAAAKPKAAKSKASKPKPATKRERKPIVRLPRPERERGKQKERRGVVVSSSMDKTIVVRVDTVRPHPAYKKVVRRSARFHAHDEQNAANPGDVVRIVETRPLSKTKSWRLAEILEVAQ